MSYHEIKEEALNNFLEVIDSLGLEDEKMGILGLALGKLLGNEVTHLCLTIGEIEGGLLCHQSKSEQKHYT